MVTLPQNHDWQVTLRNWIVGKDESDFECGLPGLSFNKTYFEDGERLKDDDIYRTWITFEDLGRRIANINGVRIAPCCYTLEEIEAEDGIYMRLYANVEPAAMAWLYSWDYPGNPYHQNEQVANRALVACMVDMMMAYDDIMEQREGETDEEFANRQKYLSQTYGSAFASWAYVFDVFAARLNVEANDARVAYKEALVSFYDAFVATGPTGIQADMDLPVLIGMHYTYHDNPVHNSYARTFFEKHFNEAGYIDHGGGFDPSYNGVSMKYMAWLAHATGWDFVIDALGKMSKLKAHLTFPEPTDEGLYKFYGPSSMATATADGSPRDQHWSFGRDVAVSYLTDEAAYLRYTGRNLNSWDQPYGLKTPGEMLLDIEVWTRRANEQEANDTYGTWTRPLGETPKIWQPSWHLDIPQLEWDYYPEGFWSEKIPDTINKPVTVYGSDYYIEQHGEDFVTWQLHGMGGAIHTGGLSWYPDRDNGGLCGLSGGSLAAFWTEKGGIGILGRSRGSQGSTPDTWDNIDSWMVEHVHGTDALGNVGSTARAEHPVITPGIDRENAVITIESNLHPLPGQCRKVFDINSERVQVTIEASQVNGWQSLFAAIPLWLGDEYNGNDQDPPYPRIHALQGGCWYLLTNEPSEVEAVSLWRNNHLIKIEFEQPYAAYLGPVWLTSYQRGRERGVPLHIDIKDAGSVRYTISGPYKHELVKA